MKIENSALNACILHTKSLDMDGYGKSWLNGKSISAHRKVYMQYFGSIPKGLCVLHSCDNRACVNIKHLRLGTPRDNSNDMKKRNRNLFGEKHPRALLTESQVLWIRENCHPWKRGQSFADAARKFKVSESAINGVISRLNWSHL